MTTRSRVLPTLAAALAGVAATPVAAEAQTVERTVLAGPSADLAPLANGRLPVDVAPDGTAAVAYLQTSGGVDRVHVVRRTGSTWSAPERLDTGVAACDTRSTRPAVGVGNGGRVVVVFPAGNATDERLCAMIAPAAGAPFAPPAGGPVIQGDTPGWTEPEIDLAPNGDGYVVVHDAMFGVFAQRLTGATFAPVGAAYPGGRLNAEALGQADPGDQRGARIAVSDDGGSATVAWTETEGGDFKLWARRLSGVLPADVGPAVEAFVPTLEGRAGQRAFSDMASVAQGGGTTWVAFRQAVDVGGMTFGRLVARTFDGAAFGVPQIVDGLADPPPESGEYPRLAVNTAGQGLSASYRQNTFFPESATLAAGAWTRGARVSPLDSEAPGRAIPAISPTGAGVVAHLRRAGTTDEVLSRTVGGGYAGAVATLSDPAFGPARAPVAAGASATHAITAFAQGAAATTRIVAAVVPLVPPAPAPAPGGGGTPVPPGPGVPTPGPDGSATTDPVARLTGLRVLPSRFRRGTRSPVRVTRLPRTPYVRFTLDRDARVTLGAEKARPGRSVAGRCVAPTRANRTRRACTRYVRVRGRAIIVARAGLNRVRFEGRLTRTRVLSPGRYRIVAVARTAAGAAKATRARFTLLTPRRR